MYDNVLDTLVENNWQLVGKGSVSYVFIGTLIYENLALKIGLLDKQTNSLENKKYKFLLDKDGNPPIKAKSAHEIERETGIINKCKSPYIIPILSSTITNNYWYFIMPRLPNSLFKLLYSREVQISSDIKMSFIRGIIKGIKTLHDAKIIHRNLKTVNILVGENNTPVISGFGYAISVEEYQSFGYNDLTVDTDSVTTVTWRAPEAYYEPGFSYASDIYSLGLLIWCIKTRLDPYEKVNDPHLLMYSINNGERLSLDDHDHQGDIKLPNQIDDIITACWDQNPNKRLTINDLDEKLSLLN